MAKSTAKGKSKGPAQSLAQSVSAQAGPVGATSSITRDEIYHRLEYYFHAGNSPTGPHVISPAAPIGPLLKNLGLSDLFININRQSGVFVPAWNSPLFHGVQFPWDSLPPTVIGIKDVRVFGDLIESAVDSYRHFGWQVT